MLQLRVQVADGQAARQGGSTGKTETQDCATAEFQPEPTKLLLMPTELKASEEKAGVLPLQARALESGAASLQGGFLVPGVWQIQGGWRCRDCQEPGPPQRPLGRQRTQHEHPLPAVQCTHLCCRQCRSWDVTPPPQLREHAVHLVHSPHQYAVASAPPSRLLDVGLLSC